MSDISIDDLPDSQPALEPYRLPKPLAELYPDEIRFFASRFIWSSNRSGFYTRTGYEKEKGWHARKRLGVEWMPLYPALVAELIEKHLDFDRFCLNADWMSPNRPKDDETAFWLGTMAGRYTYYDCIDVDVHDRVGFYGEPTRWHPDRNSRGSLWHPYVYRMMPVVRLGIDYFKKLKLFHEYCPGRVWSFSSASLGMNLYRMSPKAECPQERYQRVKDRLKAMRMDVLGGVPIEVYPEPPKTPGSKGHQQRRPCGLDSGIITDAGIVTDPIGQIRIFMNPQTPSFEAVVEAIVARLQHQYRRWIEFPEYTDVPKQRLFDQQRAEIDKVLEWLRKDCPDLESILNDSSNTASISICPLLCEGLSKADETEEMVENDAIIDQPKGQIFLTCDLEAINRTRQWVPFVMFLARNGFPSEDSFLPVISTLTKWLFYYELYDLPVEERKARIKEVLWVYCANKHNGFITRLNNGQSEEVISNIDRLVEHTIQTVNDCGKSVFMDMRYKRDRGQYHIVYEIEDDLCDLDTNNQSSICPILCGVLSGSDEGTQGWTYVADDTPLPDQVERAVVEAFRASGYKMRKKDGHYPILRAITRLINYLAASKTYQRRASQMLLTQMGFPDKSSKRERIKAILSAHDIIHRGDYRSRSQSMRYILTKRMIDSLEGHRVIETA